MKKDLKTYPDVFFFLPPYFTLNLTIFSKYDFVKKKLARKGTVKKLSNARCPIETKCIEHIYICFVTLF